MSETLKFGGGKWGVKKGSTLAYNSENGNFKPLPFTFDRSTSATRVNKEGLIEVVSNNEPRIDFLNDSKGALLLEPQRSNLVTYSEDFSNAYWTKSEASVTSGFTSPDGATNSFKLIENTNNSAHIIFASPSITLGNNIFSVFAKASERRVLGIEFPTNGILVSFDLIDGVFVNSQANPDGFSITPYANGWYRIDIQEDLTSTSAVSLSLRDDNGNRIYQGDGTSGVYIYGAQLEQGSYPTSYIPTQGSIGTRVGESCNGAGNDQVINSTEGVFYFEGKVNSRTDFNVSSISISNGTDANAISILQYESQDRVRATMKVSNVTQFDFDIYSYNRNEYLKIAVSYKNNDCKIFINGTKISTDTSATMPSSGTFDRLNFDLAAGAYDYYGSIKDVKLYNTALTDQELINLTTI